MRQNKITLVGRAMIIRNAYRHDFGGAEKYAASLALELKVNHIYSTLVTRSTQLSTFSRNSGINAINGPWWSKQDWSGINTLLFPLYFVWQAFLVIWYTWVILITDSNIVHPQSRDDFIAATVAGRILRRRVVWTDHADLKYIWQNHRIWYKNPVGKLVFLCSHLADAIILVSHSEKKLIEVNIGYDLPKKFHVVHNGVNDVPVKPVKRRSEDVKAIIFVTTSRLVIEKGIYELIDAFKRIDKKLNARLWIIGDGPKRDDIIKYIGNANDVVLFGHIDNPLGHLLAADIYIHPSYHEGFSLSIIEAAMLGKPIIACAVGGNPEIVNDKNGILVPPRDSDSLYGAMLEFLLDKAKRIKAGKESRSMYNHEFVFSEIVKEKIIPLYEK